MTADQQASDDAPHTQGPSATEREAFKEAQRKAGQGEDHNQESEASEQSAPAAAGVSPELEEMIRQLPDAIEKFNEAAAYLNGHKEAFDDVVQRLARLEEFGTTLMNRAGNTTTGDAGDPSQHPAIIKLTEDVAALQKRVQAWLH